MTGNPAALLRSCTAPRSAALLLVAYLYPGVQVTSFFAALVAALVLGLVNAVIRPILVILTLPATILTLGLFLFAAFLDLAGPLAEEEAGRLEGGGVVLEHVGAVDEAAGRLMHDARDDVADAEFLAGDGARAGDGFDLPIHGPRMSPRGLGGQPHSPGIGADLLTVSGQPVA